MPDLGKYKLNIVADFLSLPDFNHHRASDDAITCGYLLARFYTMLEEKNIRTIQAINPAMVELRSGGKIMDRRARHIIVFAKNSIGLRNLYRLISYGNLKYFKRYPIMPKSEMLRWRGSAHRLRLRGRRAVSGGHCAQEPRGAETHRLVL